jgi:hypothetical protein
MTMSQQKETQNNGRDEERLKEELRSLRKVQAPWYFESRLQQSLRAGVEPRSWVTRPVPAVALSLLGIALVGVVGYYVYVNSEVASPPVLKEESRKQPEVSQPSVAPSTVSQHQEAAPVVVPGNAGDRQQGPSDQQEQRPALQQRFETETRPRESVTAKPFEMPSPPAQERMPVMSLDTTSKRQGSMTSKAPDTAVRQPLVVPEVRVSGVTALRDSVKSVDTSSTRKDTTRARRDSLQRTPRQSPSK